MVRPNEIRKVQSQGSLAENQVVKAENLIMDVIQFACCNKFMRVLRFLFRKKFDEQYDKLSKACYYLDGATNSLDGQWNLLEEYWDNEVGNAL